MRSAPGIPGIAVDLSRLVTGLRFSRPTGIERMELGYGADLDPSGDGVILTPLGPRAVEMAGRRKIVDIARRHWREDGADLQAELEPVLRFLKGEPKAPAPPPTGKRIPFAIFPVLAKSVFHRPADRLPQGATYFHANFFRLERPAFFDWLDRRPDMRAIFTIYDLLPIQFPQFFRPGEDGLHRRRIETVARHAHRIVVAADTIAEDLRAFLRTAGLRTPPIDVVPLPVAPLFWAPERMPALETAPDFFVICGTIEPRKNHRLLLDVWRRLVARQGRNAPKLIIAGRRGWNNDRIFAELDDLGALSPFVHEAPSLSSSALATLLASCRGLLSPSISEGFGLPVAEALATGAPVMASDMPIYRELWSGQATLIDPADVGAWSDAIMASKRSQLNDNKPRVMTWADHVDRMERLFAAS